MNIQMTLDQLKELLNEQKLLTIEKLLSQTYTYNSESTEGHLKPLSIDEVKFKNIGLSSNYSEDYLRLVKYKTTHE